MALPKMIQDANNEQMQIGKIGSQEAPIASGGAALDSGILDADAPTVVRVIATQDIYFDIGVAAVATINHTILPAGVIEYWEVPAGAVFSVLQVSAAGSVRLTVLA